MNLTDIPCIFCNKYNTRTLIQENGYHGRKCLTCGLIYVSPRPSLREIYNLYSHDHAHVTALSHISAAYRKRLHAKHNLRIIKKYRKNGATLEIGAGAGYFLDESKKQGFEAYAIELNTILAQYVRSKFGIACEKSPLNISSFNGKHFEIVYHCDVISHFHDPIAEFKKINQILSNNGILVFETGNFADIKQRYLKYFTKFHYPDHLFFFGENNLKNLLELTGFELLKIYRYSILPQLFIAKMVERIRKSIEFKTKVRTQKNSKNVRTRNIIIKQQFSNAFDTNIRNFSFSKLIHNAYDYFSYFMRYKLGYVFPKSQLPQTVIIIARKKNQPKSDTTLSLFR